MAHRKPETDRPCSNCGEIFTRKHRLKKYCSDRCVLEVDNKRSLAYYHGTRKPRKMRTLKCPYCKVDFDTKNWHKIYCCTEHKTLAEGLRKKTPEYKEKHREAKIQYLLKSIEKEAKKKGWTVAERKAYGSRYYFEVIKPRLQRLKEAEALMEVPDKIPPVKIQGLTSEQIERYWGRII